MKTAFIPIIASLLAATGLDAGTTAMPAEIPAPVESGWGFRIAPYGWLTAIDGDLTVGPLNAPVDISLSDTLDKLDTAFMIVAEASKGPWSLTTDFVYADFSNRIPRDGLIGGRVLRAVEFEDTQWVLTQTLGYRVFETEDHRMDVFAGARFTSFDSTLTGRFLLGRNLQSSVDDTWGIPSSACAASPSWAGASSAATMPTSVALA